MSDRPIRADEVQSRTASVYPAAFAAVVAGRSKRKLGDHFGLRNFGINLTTLDSGAASALYHCHSVQDEFIYVLEGHPVLIFGDGEYPLAPGDCMGFRAGTGTAHQLVNRSAERVSYLEIGDRSPGEQVSYPRDDIAASQAPDGSWRITHKDGTPY